MEMMISPAEMVFVYGTLRGGGSNHFRMEGAEFVTTATVRGRLYGIDWYPGLILDGTADCIHGEIYQVSPELMASLDAFEGDGYRRVMTQARSDGDHRSPLAAWVWEWLGPVDENKRITSGDWLYQV
jgi:gamma-glutamylcyclotransferase (GGCT)/AIG2-like uncharacterized protein YtfP